MPKILGKYGIQSVNGKVRSNFYKDRTKRVQQEQYRNLSSQFLLSEEIDGYFQEGAAETRSFKKNVFPVKCTLNTDVGTYADLKLLHEKSCHYVQKLKETCTFIKTQPWFIHGANNNLSIQLQTHEDKLTEIHSWLVSFSNNFDLHAFKKGLTERYVEFRQLNCIYTFLQDILQYVSKR